MKKYNFIFSPYPYYQVNYNTLNYNVPYEEDRANNLISTRGDLVIVQPMWRMELLGKYYGVSIQDYEDDTNYELYDEMLYSCSSIEELEECHERFAKDDKYDEYFEDLAAVAAEVGCERAEIKCLIKSLMFKYRLYLMSDITDFPHDAFNELYNRLVSSQDMEQLRVAKRLARYHLETLRKFIWREINDKMMWLE